MERPKERHECRVFVDECSVSLMSDTKWRKLFLALDKPELALAECIVKFVGVDGEKTMRVPKSAALHPPRPYVDTFEFGPVLLRSIEWIEFPRTLARRRCPGDAGLPVLQDIEAAHRVLDDLGRYPIEITGRGLRVIGHVAAERPDGSLRLSVAS
jgi:hypothetical protein